MKKHIMLTLALIVSIQCLAQDRPTWSVVPFVGVNLANISHTSIVATVADDTEAELSGKIKTGIVAGAELEYAINQLWGTQIGINYAQQGCKYDSYVDPSTMKEIKISDHLHYLNLLIAPKLYVGTGFAFEAGLQAGALLSGSTDTEENGEKANTSDMKSLCNKIAVSVPVGISFEYEHVQLRLRYHFPLNRLYTETLDTSSKNRQISVSMGYRFAL